MSRSNPEENNLPNPAESIFDWKGDTGGIKCFHKAEKKTTTITPTEKDPFIFLLLQELGCVRGFDQTNNCGIYSNEIKDSRADVLIVKRHKQDTLAEGIYKTIKEKVNLAGGDFHVSIYLAYKQDNALHIGTLRLKGAALNAWIEFGKKQRPNLYKKAIAIDGVIEGKNGAVTFRVPKFSVKDVSEATEAEAIALDKELQTYLKAYFANTKQSVEHTTQHVRDEDMPSSPPPTAQVDISDADEVFLDDVPF